MKTVAINKPADTAQQAGPNFLGIGVMKGATTWLHELLYQHPDVWVPLTREMHFFNRDHYFERGLNWYLKQFPEGKDRNGYLAIGEITPNYIDCSEDRIQFVVEQVPAVKKLICIVREPADRAYSHYWFNQRVSADDQGLSFEEFLQKRPFVLDHGLYARHLQHWLKYFDQDQVLILVFEEIFKDLPGTRQQIADFLGIDAARFPAGAGEQQMNSRFSPRFPKAYIFAVQFAQKLRDLNLGGIANGLSVLGARNLFGKSKKPPPKLPMAPATREYLNNCFVEDIRELEQLMGREIPAWKKGKAAKAD